MLITQPAETSEAAGREYLARITRLAREKFAPRADDYDRAAAFPQKDFADLFQAGLHAPGVPEAYGGLGLGPGRATYVLWMMTKELARADLSRQVSAGQFL